VIADPLVVNATDISALVDELREFTVALKKDGQVVAEGAGRNSLRSPALCLAELVSVIARRPGSEPLSAGALVSSGTLTESQLIARGDTWTASVEGLDLPTLTIDVA
jgi:2-keto-4-pentenoate hydratase